ncbi:BON domain-containing protein [Nitrospira sp. Nam74]
MSPAGVVTLRATVSTSHQRSRAEQLASEVEGVTAVVNEIVVSNVRP